MQALQQKLIDSQTPQKPFAPARAEFSYMDVKEASEYTERFRAESMMLIWKLKDRRRAFGKNPVLSFLHKKELAFLERQTRDAIDLYKDSKKLYHGIYKTYLAQITPMSYTDSLYQRAA